MFLTVVLQTSLAVKSTVAGKVTALLVEDGTTVTPGTPLVTVAAGEGAATPAAASEPVAAAAPPPPAGIVVGFCFNNYNVFIY